MNRSLTLTLALVLAPSAWGQSQVTCTTSSPGTVIAACGGSGFSSPVTTDPVSATGVWTFDNAANTPVTLSDGAAGGTLCSVGVADTAASVCVGSNAVTGEGATADTSETVLAFGDATADNTLTLKGTASGVEATVTTGALLTGAGTGTGRVSVGGVLCKGAPAQATTGTAEEVLATCTIPANTLSANGSMLRVRYYGHTAANGNNKTVTVRIGGIGGTIVGGVQATAANNNAVRSLSPIEVQRASATTATVVSWGAFCALAASPASPTCTQGVVHATAAAVTWANANDLVITGTTPTAAGDLTLDSYAVEVVQ